MVSIKSMKTYFIAVVVVIAAVLIAGWFLNGGEHFKDITAVCYGFVIGWLAVWFIAQSVYSKK
jgi:preprotein translocase subunit SecF